jgi:glucose/arabinose dehydrogenase
VPVATVSFTKISSARDAAAAALAIGFTLAVAPSAFPPILAQDADCTGISDASGFDGPGTSDFDGHLTTVRVASGLNLPLFATAPPGDVERLFVVEQCGTIRILRGGTLLAEPFLDVSDLVSAPCVAGGNEEGLLGLAFHPDYTSNGWFFIYYTDRIGDQIVARYRRAPNDPDRADITSGETVLTLNHPGFFNHNGGMIAFSPNDGCLYVSSGDGGSACDPLNNAQSLYSNLGKLLRLDVDTLPYSTNGNPYEGITPGNDEIWARGVRNAWRFSFDRETSAIYFGDVGQSMWEEINCARTDAGGGQNFGWDRYEGEYCPNPSCGDQGGCSVPDYVPPLRQYEHVLNGPCAVTGGYVYRGCRMSDLHGTYFYADFCTNFIRSFRTDGSCTVVTGSDLDRAADLAPSGEPAIEDITSFGEDARGELYIVARAGDVFKVLPELSVMEVSGSGVQAFVATGSGWLWEDLRAMTVHPIAGYRVYRSDAGPAGPFDCVFAGSSNVWPVGDGVALSSGEVVFYLVTAVAESGERSSPGNRSDGAVRAVVGEGSCP